MEPIGSGPYQADPVGQGQQFILEANESYYGEQPAIKGGFPGAGGRTPALWLPKRER